MNGTAQLRYLFLVKTAVSEPHKGHNAPFRKSRINPIPVILITSDIFCKVFRVGIFLQITIKTTNAIPAAETEMAPPVNATPKLFIQI